MNLASAFLLHAVRVIPHSEIASATILGLFAFLSIPIYFAIGYLYQRRMRVISRKYMGQLLSEELELEEAGECDNQDELAVRVCACVDDEHTSS